MDFRTRLEQQNQLRNEIVELEATIEAERQARLAALPSIYGFADLSSFIEALREACGKSPKPSRPRRRLKSPGATPTPARANPNPTAPQAASPAQPGPVAAPGMSAAATSSTSTSSDPGSAPALPKPPSPPTGTSLDDPANFGLMPDRAVLERGSLAPATYRERLAESLHFATRVLHTSRVPAAVWREWRRFEQQLKDALTQPALP